MPRGELAELLRRGQAAARAGRRADARRLFRQVLALDPANEDAWLWLGFLAPSPRQRLDYLQQALSYHPQSERVHQAIVWARERLMEHEGACAQRATTQALDEPEPEVEQPATRPRRARAPRRRRRPPRGLVIGAGLAIAGLVLVAAMAARGLGGTAWPGERPQPAATSTALPTDVTALRELANDAIAREDWEATILLLERMHELSPDDDGVRQQLAVAHLRYGLQLVELDRLDEAIAHYDAAIRFYANDVDLQRARQLAVGYRAGRQAFYDGQWEQALAQLEPVYQLAPDFRDVADILFTIYLQRAVAHDSNQELEAARQAYARAAEIDPAAEDARARLAVISATLTPPTPTPTPRPHKRIEISISEQRLRAYEEDALVYDWVCSTGEPGRPTRYGSFQVIEKIPEAWSSVWGLRMPYWLGIYWAGGSQNGIHGLPIDVNGQQLWAGFLGHRVSYGCVIVDTPNAAQLYEWADIGTPVAVVP
jgi:tetratricopeptide (TPR) repeat protein